MRTAFLIQFLIFSCLLCGQELQENVKDSVLNKMQGLIEEFYVDGDLALQIVDSLLAQQYDESRNKDFGRRLTRDLRKYSDDQLVKRDGKKLELNRMLKFREVRIL